MQVYQPQITGNFFLEAALMHVANYSAINKFGHAPDCDSGVDTDIWDGADGVTSTDIWVAPTAARIHAIVSSDVNDTAAGTGAQSVEVFGLIDWDNGFTTHETIVLNGTTPVNTVNPYVIVHRLQVHDTGSGGTNAGIIKATAAVDSTITALIRIGNRQTQMAIYGVPTNFLFAITAIHSSVDANSSANILGKLLVKVHADTATGGFAVKRQWTFRRDSRIDLTYAPPFVIEGPAIVKIQVTSDTANVAVNAHFDGIIHEKKFPSEHVDT